MDQMEKNYTRKKKEVSLMGIFGKESLESIQKKYADATDFSFSTIDFKGDEVTDSLILNTYCEKKQKSGACTNCKMTMAFAAAKAAFTNDPYIYECEQGLVGAAIPVIVNNQYLGAVMCGRIRCQDKENLPDLLSNGNGNSHKEENSRFLPYYEEIPEFSYDKIRAIAGIVAEYFKERTEKESLAILNADYAHKEIHLKDLRKKNASLLRHSKINDLKALRASLSPQLLINMLITISHYAILENAEETQKLVEKLAGILRYYVENEKDKISLQEEIQKTEDYLQIFAEKYSNRLKVRVTHKTETERQMIPKLIVFPLVDYLVCYGVLSNNSKGTIYVDTTYTIDRCVITLQFDCADSDQSMMGYLNVSGKVIDEVMINDQINSIKKRLEYEFGEDFSLKMQKNVIVLNIPRTVLEDEVEN